MVGVFDAGVCVFHAFHGFANIIISINFDLHSHYRAIPRCRFGLLDLSRLSIKTGEII